MLSIISECDSLCSALLVNVMNYFQSYSISNEEAFCATLGGNVQPCYGDIIFPAFQHF